MSTKELITNENDVISALINLRYTVHNGVTHVPNPIGVGFNIKKISSYYLGWHQMGMKVLLTGDNERRMCSRLDIDLDRRYIVCLFFFH